MSDSGVGCEQTGVEKLDHVSLLSLSGRLQGRKFRFLLDSGASGNFIGVQQLKSLGIDHDLCIEQNVRLADGSTLKTCGEVTLRVQFGPFTYVGKFFVLGASVPFILGMQFFQDVDPVIEWRQKTVHVLVRQQKLQLPVVSDFEAKSASVAVKTRPCVASREQNSFANLEVFEGSDDLVGAKLSGGDTSKLAVAPVKSQKRQKTCVQCGCYLGGTVGKKCGKCQNHSQMHVCSGLRRGGRQTSIQGVHTQGGSVKPSGHVGSSSVRRASQTSTGKGLASSESTVCEYEIVNLKQFVRGGKCNQYLNFGVITLDTDVDDVAGVCQNDQSLNFTHRAAHGGNDDIDVEHGGLEKLAVSQLDILKKKYPEVFCDPVYPVDRSDCERQFHHSIPLIEEGMPPPKKRLYPLDSVELVELKKQIQEFLESNRIEPANGPYGAPILFAKKKDGRLRMCIDYRMLNQQTQNDVFPLPRIDELLQRLDGAQIFSKLDLRDGYHQIPMTHSDKQKTAFTCRYGTFQFTVMPFGLMSAPSTFQRMMNQVFFELLDNGVLCYLDDLLIYSRTIEEHKVLLDKVFGLLKKYKLYIKESKCHLFLEKVNFLGHVVDKHGVSLESGKVDAVKNWPVPTNVNQVQQFLGLCNYYRRFVLRFSELAGPLTLLTRKGQQFVWNVEQQQAFEKLKSCLCSAPVLKVFNPALQTRVVCDASQFCVGAVLEQYIEGKWYPVEYFSKRLSKAERNYSATDREFVAIRQSLERWRQFLVGCKFLLLTDHAALTYLQTTQHVSRRNARWLEFLSQFDFTIEHIKGKENIVADALSRIPGTESLPVDQVCSSLYTLGLCHIDDVCCTSDLYLSGVITIHENDTFLKQLRAEQDSSDSMWFKAKCQQAVDGSSVFQFRNGILCKLVHDHFCPVIPDSSSSSVHVVLSELHSSALAGHFGSKKLLKLAQQRFYWQNMFATVEKFCRECPVCQANKGSTQKPGGLLQPVENPDKPFAHVTMDFVTQLPVSERGFDCIFTIVDRFSRLVRFIPCQTSISADGVAKLFFEHWVCRHGMPSKIVCDRDTRFQSQFWQSLMKLLQCRVAMSTAYHPQTDGLSERYHRSVEQILRCYCSSQQHKWCALLSQCEFALNSTYQDAVGDVPFKVVFGFVPVVPLDINVASLKLPAVQDIMSTRSQVHTQVKESLAAAQQRMEGVANPARRAVQFEQGEYVWLSTRHLPLRLGTRKLAAKWAGPYRVEQRVTAEAYKLTLPSSWRVHSVFHTSQLKPAKGQPQSEEAILLDSGQEEYEVEAVLASRLVRGRRQYLVSWRGYGSYEDSWEPERNLSNARAKLEEFWQREKSLARVTPASNGNRPRRG